MDVERTMQFILDCQARAEARAEKAEGRMDRADARAEKAETRMDRAEARMDRADARAEKMEKRLDRRMDGITKLLQQGMKMLGELAQAQKATERSLKTLINSMGHSRNGRNGR